MCTRAVARAARSLAQPDQLVSDAVDVRTELDLRIGNELLIHCDLPLGHIVSMYKTTRWMINCDRATCYRDGGIF